MTCTQVKQHDKSVMQFKSGDSRHKTNKNDFGQDSPSQAFIFVELLQCKSLKKCQESLKSFKFVYKAKCYSVILKKWGMERHLLNKQQQVLFV